MDLTRCVEEILVAAGYRARSRALDRLGGDRANSEKLAEEFRRRAHAALRTDPAEAQELARLGCRAARGIEASDVRIACYRAAAQAAVQGGRYATCLRMLDRAAAVAGDADEKVLADLASLRILALTHLERYEEARDAAESALPVFQTLGDLNGVVRTRISLAELEFRLDQPRAALRQYARIDRMLPDDAPARLRGIIAGNRANSLEAVNRFRAATRQFEIAKDLFEKEGCDHTVAQVEYNAAYADMLRGRFEDALRRYSRVEPEFEKLSDERHLAHTELDRAEIHLALNLPDDARKLADLAERRFAKLGLEKERAQSAHLAGRAAEIRGDTIEAERLYRRAEEGFSSLGLDERRIGCIIHRASLALAAGRRDDARELLLDAENAHQVGMNPLGGTSIALLCARLHLAENDTSGALARVREALARCRRVHAPWVEIEARRIQGRAEKLAGRTKESVAAYRRAIEVLENYRGGVPPDEYMAAFLAGRFELYEEIVELLVAVGEAEEAFEFAERAKSRALVDLLAGDRGARTLTSARLEHLRERLNAIYARLFAGNADSDERSVRAVMKAQREAQELEHHLARMLRETRLRDPEAASLLTADAPDLAEIRRTLEPGVTFVQYFVTADSLFTFVVDRERLSVVRQDVGAADIRLLLVRFHFHLSKYARPDVRREAELLVATRANLEKLSAILLDPIADRLEGSRLVVAPHGVLHHVPFHALPHGRGWLCDEFEVVCTPNAAVYGFCEEKGERADGEPSVFGLPDRFAPLIEEEAKRVGGILGTDRVYLNGDATLERLREEAPRARVLHIATHGMFRHAQPMLSAIRLADGWMNLYDLYDLRVGGEIVVLSTCESGTADVTDGDEILGLTRGFLYAGAPALLTSQWRVNDEVTSEFMDCFHRHLSATGDAAAAHRQTLIDVRARHPHPYFWAPFFLTGRPLKRAGETDVVRSFGDETSAKPRALVTAGRSDG